MANEQTDFGFSGEPADPPRPGTGASGEDPVAPDSVSAPEAGAEQRSGSADPERFAAATESVFGDDLRALLVHGPDAHRGTAPHPEPPEYNLVVILRELGIAELDRASPAVREWVAGGQPPPLFFSEDRLANSAAVFPVELLDMKEANRVLRGRDLVSPLEVRKTWLLQGVERGLKMRLHQLAELRMLRGGDPDAENAALLAHLPRLNLLVRSLLRFHTPRNPSGMLEAVRKLDIYLPGSAAGMLSLYRHVWGVDTGADTGDRQALMESLFASLRVMIAGVEKLREKLASEA